MNLQLIVADLKKERDRIDRAIATLSDIGMPNASTRTARNHATSRNRTPVRPSKRGHLSAAGRKRLSELMKKRWAERRRKTSSGRKTAARPA
jgi:hypothetical protein